MEENILFSILPFGVSLSFFLACHCQKMMDKKKPGGDCNNPTDTVEANFCLLNEPIIGKGIRGVSTQ